MIGDLRAALGDRGVAVLVAPPGTGKTTGVPPALLGEPWMHHPGGGRSRIVVVEPRRLAARSAARRIAATIGEPPGRTVGWSVRGDQRVSTRTRIEMVTGGLLLRRLQADPALDGVAAVLLDEFHERSIDDDLLLALLLDVRSSLRPDLRLVAMSATLETTAIARVLGGTAPPGGTPAAPAPVITAVAPIHPVTTFHRPAIGRQRLEQRVADAVREAVAAGPGDVLVFLPGRAEIRRAASALSGAGPDVVVCELHGGLDAGQQDAALRPDPAGRRRVVLATSVAETSITVPSVRAVVDSGRRRTVRVHPATGLPGLVTEPVSIAGADQRRGRAGRTGPGRCYRLWSIDEERHRPTADRPGVLDGDLAPMLLQVTAWGTTVDELDFPDPPSRAHLASAAGLLADLGALDEDGRLTRRGRRLARLGFHPRLGTVVLAAQDGGAVLGRDSAAELAGILESDLPGDVDLVDRLRALRRGDAPAQVRDAVREWRRRLAAAGEDDAEGDAEGDENRVGDDRPDGTDLDRAVAVAVVAGYRDRLARRRDAERTDHRGRRRPVFQLVGGGEVALDTRRSGTTLATSRWLAIISLNRAAPGAPGSSGSGEGRTHLAVAVPDDVALAALTDRITIRRDVRWDAPRREPVATERRTVGAVTLDERPWRDPSAEAVGTALLDGIRSHGPADVLDRWPEADELVRRLDVAGIDSGAGIDTGAGIGAGAVGPGDVLVTLVERIVATGRTDRAALAEVDVARWILDGLTWSDRRDLDERAPTHVELPSGRRVRVHYTPDGPVMSTRLQDLLGSDAQPTVGHGRIPIVVELLSPAGRPLQRTADLPTFWRGSYAAVRAEMRGRYPKHTWPERPWE